MLCSWGHECDERAPEVIRKHQQAALRPSHVSTSLATRLKGVLCILLDMSEISKMGKDSDVFCTPDNRTFHLGVKKGELSPLILTVGCQERARFLAEALLKHVNAVVSPRLFVTLTGYYKDVQVSIVAIGMGVAAMDFLVREASHVLDGRSMAIVRLGTCGIFIPDATPGTLMLADRSAYCYRNYLHFDGEFNPDVNAPEKTNNVEYKKQPPYVLSAPVKADPHLTAVIREHIKKAGVPLKEGLNCSAETFYACQGRVVHTWDDEVPSSFLDTMRNLGVQSMEMETHQLFHLIQHRQVKSYSAAVMYGIFNRVNPDMGECATADEQHAIRVAGEAALEALTSLSDRVMPQDTSSTSS